MTRFRFPFYAMRHGETSWNAKGFFQGHADVPLSSAGILQIENNAHRLGIHLESAGTSLSSVAILSSPLSRALHSSRIICAAFGLAENRVIVDPRLKEASFGHWEGLTTLEVKQRFREERRSRKRDRWNFAPVGGQSYADISSAMQYFLAGLSGDGPLLIVTHTGNIRVMLRLLQDLEPEMAMATPIPQDRVLYWDGECAGWI